MISMHLRFEVLNLLLYSSVRLAFGVGVFLVEMFETLAFVYRVTYVSHQQGTLLTLFTFNPKIEELSV